MSEGLPFAVVDRDARRTPLQQKTPPRCEHNRAYQTDKYVGDGFHWKCADCGQVSKFVRDFR